MFLNVTLDPRLEKCPHPGGNTLTPSRPEAMILDTDGAELHRRRQLGGRQPLTLNPVS